MNKKRSYQVPLKNGWQYLRKLRYIILELFIVFVGVYSAFYLNTYNQNQQEQENRRKVLVALSEEVRHLGKTFKNIKSYQAEFNKMVEKKYEENLPIPEVERIRYAAPQYSLEVLENALQSNTFELLDLPERKISEVSQDYVFIVDASEEARRKQYGWSILYLDDRRDILERLTEASENLVVELESRIDKKNLTED